VSFRGDAKETPRLELEERRRVIPELKREVQWPATSAEGTKDPRWDGILIRRGYYNKRGQFGLEGLCDTEAQKSDLQALARKLAAKTPYQEAFMQGLKVAPQRPLDLERLRPMPLAPMQARIERVMPAHPVFDGMALEGLAQDVNDKLVVRIQLVGVERGSKGEVDQLNRAAEELLNQIRAHRVWSARVPGGLRFHIVQWYNRDVNTSDGMVHRSITDLKTALYHCRSSGPDPMPKGVTPQNYLASAKRQLDYVLLHQPGNATAWYLRGLYHVIQKDREAATRDLRRMQALMNIRGVGTGRHAIRPSLLEALQGDDRRFTDGLLRAIAEDERPPITVSGTR